MRNGKRYTATLLSGLLLFALTACGQSASPDASNNKTTAETPPAKTPSKVVLDWTPNTNHTGLYVALEKGYFTEQGLDMEIVQPGMNGADTMVATGEIPFGVSYQEGVTQARTQNVPIVSLAAVIQHNTSGFASPVSKNILSPKDFEGKTYGGYGAPSEKAVLQSLMSLDKADVNKLNIINVGDADYFTAVKRDIDFAWIFYAWTGIEAELRNEPINMIYVNKYSDKLDYYTPVLITNEKMIQEKPEVVKAFMAATSQGYQYASKHPEEAASILLKHVPDLDEKLVKASQKWLSPRYQDDAPRWGEQKRDVWQGYSDWMVEHQLLEKPLDVDKAFTNDFLPKP
ncbi:ABC transporter substrate-binding protein [Brevibacterium sp. JNUCC-42]|nr:ABC transporter substrate-binding protein [Brevibacterium sp. JNUCC-42]